MAENWKWSTPYLGVTMSSNLSWNAHITKIVSKANRMLGFIRRNLYNCPRQLKETAYVSMVRPNLEYCSTVWSPYTESDSHRIEMVQRRAARFVTGEYRRTTSVTGLLTGLGWNTLAQRRDNSSVMAMYKIVNQLVEIDGSPYLMPVLCKTRQHHSQCFRQIQCSIRPYQGSFFPRTISLWNSLPADVVEAPTLEAFRTRLKATY